VAIAAAADLLSGVTDDLDWAGRPLGGPNAALPVPAEPLARLWRAATVLREHRGDGHVAALVAADLDGCEALILRAGADLAAAGGRSAKAAGPGAAGSDDGWSAAGVTRQRIQSVRGWTDEQWEQAAARLADRGLIHAGRDGGDHGRICRLPRGGGGHRPRRRPSVGQDRSARDRGTGRGPTPVARAAAAGLPYPNPIGVPAP